MRPSPAVELRSVESADEAFLYDLETRTRGEELARAGLPATLVAMQADARRRAYTAASGTGGRRVVLCDGTPVGTVWLGDAGDAVVVVDLVIAPEHQGRRVGTALLQRVVADAAPRPLRLSVADDNPAALRLYRSLGFVEMGRTPGYLQLSRPAVPEGAA